MEKTGLNEYAQRYVIPFYGNNDGLGNIIIVSRLQDNKCRVSNGNGVYNTNTKEFEVKGFQWFTPEYTVDSTDLKPIVVKALTESIKDKKKRDLCPEFTKKSCDILQITIEEWRDRCSAENKVLDEELEKLKKRDF